MFYQIGHYLALNFIFLFFVPFIFSISIRDKQMDTRTDGQAGKRTEDELYIKKMRIYHILLENFMM